MLEWVEEALCAKSRPIFSEWWWEFGFPVSFCVSPLGILEGGWEWARLDERVGTQNGSLEIDFKKV